MADRTKPLPRTQRRLEGRELNRGLQRGRGSETNQRKDNVKNISIGLMDVDAAIMYYFNEVNKKKTTINTQKNINLNFTIEKNLYERFKQVAQKDMRKYSNIVESSIRRYIQSKL